MKKLFTLSGTISEANKNANRLTKITFKKFLLADADFSLLAQVVLYVYICNIVLSQIAF